MNMNERTKYAFALSFLLTRDGKKRFQGGRNATAKCVTYVLFVGCMRPCTCARARLCSIPLHPSLTEQKSEGEQTERAEARER